MKIIFGKEKHLGDDMKMKMIESIIECVKILSQMAILQLSLTKYSMAR
jgi:hypothetical protein